MTPPLDPKPASVAGNQRDNLNPTPEARLAMAVWSHEYAYQQRGGSMDFWRNIGASRQGICRNLLRDVAKAAIAHGMTLEGMAGGGDGE